MMLSETLPESLINLEDILVTESMRGHKIGTLLFDALINEAK